MPALNCPDSRRRALRMAGYFLTLVAIEALFYGAGYLQRGLDDGEYNQRMIRHAYDILDDSNRILWEVRRELALPEPTPKPKPSPIIKL
jgi:hypothetical protein